MLTKKISKFADPSCTPNPSKMLRLMNGKEVDRKTILDKAEVIACGNLLPTSHAIYGFTSEEEFQEWADSLFIADSIRRIHEFVHEARKYENDGLASIEAIWKEYIDSMTDLLKKLANREGVAENSRDLFLVAEGLSGHPLQPKVLNSAILYQHINFGGSWRPVTGPIPHLSLIGFNDTTSSVRMFGTGFLAQHGFWRGRRFYMLGIPWIEFADLREFDFNDRASSVLLT